MFRKKTTRWVMAMTMMGMMSAVEAQTIDKNWVRQNAANRFQARTAIRFANTTVNVYQRNNSPSPSLSFSEGLAPYKDAYINAAKDVGAPYVDVVSDSNAPRTRETCWGATAWMKMGNEKAFSEAVVQEVAKQGLPELGFFPGLAGGPYFSAACENLQH